MNAPRQYFLLGMTVDSGDLLKDHCQVQTEGMLSNYLFRRLCWIFFTPYPGVLEEF